ncbi:response regulator transcription factor [Diaphorobacter sp. HDW4A]|uniref:response regulator transcription factor n=1 Tax=Diaphorobacter sp. HDW4A TaxID=2714924 RepID=UPI00140CD0C8|nr:response regulator [Diaphorobacter sp. HDW4A]QIL78539.1 response regulator transcription factor [Diaphorobacter sp. HDW4A]
MTAPASTPQMESGLVYVVDDDAAIRTALDSLLRSLGLRVQVFARVADFLARDAAEPGPTCLVLDVRLPDINGLDLLHAASRTGGHPLPPTIMITGHGDIPMSVRAMKAGAVEFLSKPFREGDLLRAINEALVRDRAEHHAREELTILRTRYASLTRREHEVLHAVVDGLLNKQIAAQLGMSEATVKQHRAQVMRKMGLSTLAMLVRSMERLIRSTDGLTGSVGTNSVQSGT